MPNEISDTLSAAGAEQLAYKLRQYWLDRGYTIKTRIEAFTPKENTKYGGFGVRSNLMNGLPPESCRINIGGQMAA